MSTLIENINRIYTDKEAIIAKGISVPDGTSLDEYADLISEINDGIDTEDATAIATDIAFGKTAYIKGEKVTGIAVNITDAIDVPKGKFYSSVINDAENYPNIIKGAKFKVAARTVLSDLSKHSCVRIYLSDEAPSPVLIRPGGALEVTNNEIATGIGLSMTPEKIVSGYSILGVLGKG